MAMYFNLAPPPRPPALPIDPCVPSPCGLYSTCHRTGDVPSCSCLPGYIGSAPNCRPECTINSDCSSDLACIRERCVNPCPGSCGVGAKCDVVNHTPICTCFDGLVGDPFVKCEPKPFIRKTPVLLSTQQIFEREIFSCTSRTGPMQSIAMWTKRNLQQWCV